MSIKRELQTWGPFLLLLLPLIWLANYQQPNARQARLDAKLIAAVHSHDSAAALSALAEGANPNVRDYYRPTPTLLIRLRHPDAAKIDDAVHAQEWLPVLSSAVIFDSDRTRSDLNDKIVQALLRHGADVNGRDYAGDRVLGAAAYQGRLDWVRELLDRGADAGSRAEALSAAVNGDQPDVMRLLIARGADVNAQDRFRLTPLTGSCLSHQTALIRLLLRHGADPSRRDGEGDTALQVALRWRRPDPALVRLLENDADRKKDAVRK